MAQFAVDLLFRGKGQGELDKFTQGASKVDNAAKKAQGSLDALTGKFSKSGQAIRQSAGGLEYFIDKVGRARKANGQFVTSAEAATNGISVTGRAAKGAAGGVKVFGAAFQAALGPIGLALAGIGGLTAAFKTLESQNFAEAKVRSLGVNSKKLVTQLKAVSKELKGQASVVELTGAAYDVASAGFNNAADASKILKAASLGATGGFSDINTVANATTSVLNAYGLSADKAGKLVDGFIQTQNDGKIVIGEYANNIGKLAPIAATLGVPLEEINGAIAAVTANGVNAEIGITGLRSALAKLGANSEEATDILAGYGVQINATTIGQEGLLKTLQKLQKVTDKTDLLKIIGTEAGQAIAPLLNDLGKLEKLIANQGNAAGAAATAQTEAANTIKGAWTAVGTAFQNAFSEQSAAAEAIVPLLQGIAAAVEAISSPAGVLVIKIGLVTAAVVALNAAIVALKASALAGWITQQAALMAAFGPKIYATAAATGVLTKALGLLKVAMLALPWVAAAAGLTAFTVWAYKSVTASQALAETLRGGKGDLEGLSTAIALQNTRLEDAVTKLNGMTAASVQNQGAIRQQTAFVAALRAELENLQGQYSVQIAIETFLNGQGVDVKSLGDGFYGPGGAAPAAKAKPAITMPFGGGGGKGKGKGGGGGGGGAAPRESQVPQLQGELKLKQNLLAIDKEILEAQFTGNRAAIELLSIEKAAIELAGEVAAIKLEKLPVDEEELKIQAAQVGEAEKLLQLQYQNLEADKQRREALKGVIAPIEDEIELLQAKLAGNEEEIRQKQEILRLQEAIAGAGGDPSAAAGLVKSRDALKAFSEQQDAAKAKAEELSGAIAGSLTDSLRGLIDGSMTAEEALSNAFQGIADAFLDMAMKMIQEWITMQIIGLVGSVFGGGGGGGFGAGSFNLSGGQFGAFADGGHVSGPTKATVGEGGADEYIIPSNKMGAAMERWNSGARGDAVVKGANGSSGEANGENQAEPAPQISISGGVMQFGSDDYIRKDQLPSIISQAGKQGEARTLRRLQMSSSTRKRLGF